jgi:hypothetical protein
LPIRIARNLLWLPSRMAFPLDEIVAAHRCLESNQQLGKVVATVGGESGAAAAVAGGCRHP